MNKYIISLFILVEFAFANPGAGAQNVGQMASMLRGQFVEIASLMIAVAYVAGIGFGISSIFMFKQHKDNPTQVPIGKPLAILTISVLLIFLPAIYVPAGTSIFGTGAELISGSATGRIDGLPGDDVSTPPLGTQ